MIIIKDLVKKYKSKNKRVCTAINGISLNLPEHGMVFIIGKSGSGKSTLLNLIGGLDGFDGGSIVAGGNDLADFHGEDFYKYRASYIGFIFQDYHLIEELTVKENIQLEAEIAGKKDFDVEKALVSVDLDGYAERYPDELSGGQKQRVAIARALIKEPRVILCDEPTGNLDNNTSRQIMDLLKEISKQRLVLIVSHNVPDAKKYADRIIELASGKIVSDITKKEGYENSLIVENDTIKLPFGRSLTDEEATTLFNEISSGRAKRLLQNDSGYENTPHIPERKESAPLLSSKINPKIILKLFSAFTSVGKGRTAVTALISAVMLVLLIIFQSFLSFNSADAINNSVGATGGNATIVLKKDTYVDKYGNVDTSKLYKVTDEDLAKITSLAGNGSKTYLLYDYAIPVNMANRPSNVESEKFFMFNFGNKHIYSPQMPGVLMCDTNYLTDKFGEIKVIAGDISLSQNSAGVIITDYLADAMIVFNPLLYRTYNDVLGAKIDEANHVWGTVAAIIDTGYKEKYADIIEAVRNAGTTDTVGLDLIDKSVATRLIDDVKTNLTIGYTINPNFFSEILKEENRNYTRLTDCAFSVAEKSIAVEYATVVSETYSGVELNDGEILLKREVLQELFPQISNQSFTFPFDLTVTKYEYPNAGGEILYEKTFTVKGEATYTTMSENDFKEYKGIDIIPYSVYVANCENPSAVIDGMTQNYYSWNCTDGTAITLLNKSVNMFFDLFRFIEILILLMTLTFLVSHSIRSIKNNYYQIGVIKAIGGKSLDISKIFILQNILICVVISLLTLIGSYVFIDLANEILITSFMAITKASIGSITIMSFDILLVLAVIGIAALVSVVSTVIPLLLLYNIKPINIIKAKE